MILLTFVIAIMVGIVAGLLPGLGMLNVMIICWFFLSNLDVVNLLVFYVVVAGTTQFVGSVVASTTGVPGESSSIPACIEGPRLFAQGKGIEAIAMAALGSFLGTTIVGFGLLIGLQYLNQLAVNYYGNTFQTIIFCLVMLLMLFTTSNRIMVNASLMLFGCSLALFGNSLGGMGTYRVNFGIAELYAGLPLEILAITLLAIPQVLKHMIDIDYIKVQKIPILDLWQGLKIFPKYAASSLRGTAIGSVTGMIPGVALTISSMVAYHCEKLLRQRQKYDVANGDMHSLISAETANNAAVLISMVPVFLFGLPIVGSEALLINLIEQSGTKVGFGILSQEQYFVPTVFYFLMSGLIGLCVAWFGARHILKLFKIPGLVLRSAILIVLILSALYAGHVAHAMLYYTAVFAVFLPIGIALRKFDVSIVIFSFLVYPLVEGSLIRFAVLNF